MCEAADPTSNSQASRKKRQSAPSQTTEEKSRVLQWLDTIAKLVAALAVVGATTAGAIIGNEYQSKMGAATLLSQREQAESNLRATMFSNLIGPIAGPQKDKEVPPERETLLVELLALNFHDHFELKPLLEFVDERTISKMDPEEVKKTRDSLRSIARRIIDRQIASLLKEGSEKDRTIVHQLRFVAAPENLNAKQKEYLKILSDRGKVLFVGRDFDSYSSPDGAWKLDLTVQSAEENGNVKVAYNCKSRSEVNPEGYQGIGRPFTLTFFDFPLTDNTLLADGNRFAVTIQDLLIDNDLKIKTVYLKLIWFPKSYFTARERPINYTEFREKLGLTIGKSRGIGSDQANWVIL
jgi:hypothetical protein